MSKQFCLTLAFLLASSAPCRAFAPSVDGVSAPVLAWSSRSLLSQKAASNYEIAETSQSTTSLVLSALGKLASNPGLFSDQGHADVVVVYMGSEVDAAVLRQASRLQQMQPFSTILEGAQTSLVMPFLKAYGESQIDSLHAKLQSFGMDFKTLGCDSPVEDLASAAVESINTHPSLKVLFICPKAQNTADSEALEREVAIVSAVHDAVEATGKNILHLYAGQPSHSAQRRSLQQVAQAGSLKGFGNYTTCGTLCQTQTRWLEGMLALLFTALASCAGMTCLYVLNTPDRFESVKGDSGSQ